MSGLFTFILIVQAFIALAMITVILMQRSEGGGFAGGGSPSGLMTARGASDFLTRSTSILATIFVGLSIILAGLAANTGGPRVIDPNLARQAPAGPAQPQQPFTLPGTPQAAPTEQAPAPAATNESGGVPIAQ